MSEIRARTKQQKIMFLTMVNLSNKPKLTKDEQDKLDMLRKLFIKEKKTNEINFKLIDPNGKVYKFSSYNAAKELLGINSKTIKNAIENVMDSDNHIMLGRFKGWRAVR